MIYALMYGGSALIVSLATAYYRARWTNHMMRGSDKDLEVGLLIGVGLFWPLFAPALAIYLPFKKIYASTTPQRERDAIKRRKEAEKRQELEELEVKLREFSAKHALPWIS